MAKQPKKPQLPKKVGKGQVKTLARTNLKKLPKVPRHTVSKPSARLAARIAALKTAAGR
ncbi:MAG TPA: hypothetical protein VFB69_08045 [Candidatus Dormibacteraeota bacterium]|nr:hypothetical protein [Candidatus Dormibacteraeota bacterium]